MQRRRAPHALQRLSTAAVLLPQPVGRCGAGTKRVIEANRMTPLDKPLRRELLIDELPYTLTIDPDGLKLVPKGKRKGLVLRWAELVSGDAALAAALQASL